MVSDQSPIVRRHKNPVGIFARVFIYPLIAFGLWEHRPGLIAVGLALEALNWTAIPPVPTTFAFIEDAVRVELAWLQAPPGRAKTLSVLLLALFPLALATGLWMHSYTLLAAAAVLIGCFHLLMRRLGDSSS